ncbi:putative leucine-rich repeat receptor serine/threonine-protein kinase [Trifolium repens]|nr:putative leucine-rich repeat receptor serine/threonine-protein kinase [Trifolium repens]
MFSSQLLIQKAASRLLNPKQSSVLPIEALSCQKALEAITQALGKKDWYFDIDPCSNKPKWVLSCYFIGLHLRVCCSWKPNSAAFLQSPESSAAICYQILGEMHRYFLIILPQTLRRKTPANKPSLRGKGQCGVSKSFYFVLDTFKGTYLAIIFQAMSQLQLVI